MSHPAVLARHPRAESLLGETLGGRFRVKRILGGGGMGVVYEAMQLGIQRAVAVKVLLAGESTTEEATRRFHREAAAASRLEHPNTIRVVDFGATDDGDLWLAMELLRGQTLGDLLQQGQAVSTNAAAAILKQVLKSLAEAHARGIVHRDLKPENIFLKEVHGEPWVVKVLDFGIAQVAPEMGMDAEELTRTGFVVGTPGYMSPEQLRGTELDGRTDLYSLGLIGYELLAGRKPWPKKAPIYRQCNYTGEPPPAIPLEAEDAARSRLAAWVMRLLSFEADERPAGASEALGLLEAEKEAPGPAPAQSLPAPTARVAVEAQAPVTECVKAVADDGLPDWVPPTVGAAAWAPTEALPDAPTPVSEYSRTPATELQDVQSRATGPAPAPQPPLATGVVPEVATHHDSPPLVPIVAAAVAVGMLAAGGGVWWWNARAQGEALRPAVAAPIAEPAAEKQKAPVVEPAEAAPSRVIAPVEEPDAVRVYAVQVHSIPTGARLLHGGEPLGVTPTTLSWRHGERAPSFIVELPGHEPVPVSLAASDAEAGLDVVLRPVVVEPTQETESGVEQTTDAATVKKSSKKSGSKQSGSKNNRAEKPEEPSTSTSTSDSPSGSAYDLNGM